MLVRYQNCFIIFLVSGIVCFHFYYNGSKPQQKKSHRLFSYSLDHARNCFSKSHIWACCQRVTSWLVTREFFQSTLSIIQSYASLLSKSLDWAWKQRIVHNQEKFKLALKDTCLGLVSKSQRLAFGLVLVGQGDSYFEIPTKPNLSLTLPSSIYLDHHERHPMGLSVTQSLDVLLEHETNIRASLLVQETHKLNGKTM